MEKEVTWLVLLAIALVIISIPFGKLIFNLYFVFEEKRIEVAERNKIQAISKERSEDVEKIDAEMEQ